ncbi:MAG: phosphatidate cytidylyltransferase [Gammaproteobacteria bacterium]|jgi:phosphatidate cytidylyltransferase
MLRQRIATGVVLAALFIAAVFLLDTPWFSLVTGVLAGVAAWEWGRLAGMHRVIERILYLIVVTALLLVCYALRDTAWSQLLIMCAAFGWILVLVEVIAVEKGLVSLPASRPLKELLGLVILVPAWLALVMLHATGPESRLILLLPVVLVWVADSAAYFTGRRWGHSKLAPHISPGKTREGLYGALAASLVVALGWVLYDDIQGLNILIFLILCLVTVLASVLGDLLVSLMKRSAQVKDSGHLLPGHGGLLDRIDSLTAAMPVFAAGLLLIWSTHL